MPKFALDFSDLPVEPDFIGPRIPACKFEDHEWRLSIEDGQPHVGCLNPCSEYRKLTMDYDSHPPSCDLLPDFMDTVVMEEIPVTLEMETQYWPGEFGGQGEYDVWLKVTPS